MGVGVNVDSITIPLARHVYGPEKIIRRERELLLAFICTVFDWKSPPWDEPSEDSGISDSIGNGRYSLLLSLAWAIEDLAGEADQHVLDLIRVVEETRRSPSEHQYPQLRGNCQKFPHTLDRNIYTSFYLPVDIPAPMHLEISPQFKHSHLYDDGISLASSQRFLAELQVLQPLLQQIVEIRGADTRVPSYENYRWGSVYAACETLLSAAEDSLRLNLPLLVSG